MSDSESQADDAIRPPIPRRIARVRVPYSSVARYLFNWSQGELINLPQTDLPKKCEVLHVRDNVEHGAFEFYLEARGFDLVEPGRLIPLVEPNTEIRQFVLAEPDSLLAEEARRKPGVSGRRQLKFATIQDELEDQFKIREQQVLAWCKQVRVPVPVATDYSSWRTMLEDLQRVIDAEEHAAHQPTQPVTMLVLAEDEKAFVAAASKKDPSALRYSQKLLIAETWIKTFTGEAVQLA